MVNDLQCQQGKRNPTECQCDVGCLPANPTCLDRPAADGRGFHKSGMFRYDFFILRSGLKREIQIIVIKL